MFGRSAATSWRRRARLFPELGEGSVPAESPWLKAPGSLESRGEGPGWRGKDPGRPPESRFLFGVPSAGGRLPGVGRLVRLGVPPERLTAMRTSRKRLEALPLRFFAELEQLIDQLDRRLAVVVAVRP